MQRKLSCVWIRCSAACGQSLRTQRSTRMHFLLSAPSLVLSHNPRGKNHTEKGRVIVVAISPQPPDLFLCDFFLWVYEKGLVFVPPLPANIEKMKQRITAALETVIKDMLQRVWHELEYRINGCRVTGGAHIEHLWKSVIEPTNIWTFLCKFNQ